MINPHDIEKIILDWLGVVTAVSAAILGTVTLLWARWKSTMKDLLNDQADEINKKTEEKKP